MTLRFLSGDFKPYLDRIFLFPNINQVICGPAIAGDLHGTFLCIKGIHLQVHGTGESQRHADAEQNCPVSVQPNVEVGNENVVHGAPPLVPEESVRHPDLAGVGDGEVGDLVCEGRILNTAGLSYC